ncbi:hypothetical protein Ddye_016575 [Dipteronia dyeriana]|uniref:DUF4283 domain-containing protein n=1 Tax=Dipteronia dyeriana TaxID=168575 RepID=A0AAD9U7N3_9ROSI|nr:hypothetical protein Ddye_016575 [Dipteronia dyeriana]
MSTTAINNLCESLFKIAAYAPLEVLDSSLQAFGQQKLDLCLVVLANMQVNGEAFRTTIPRFWKTSQEVEIEVISDNVFAFFFQNQDDRRRVLTGGLWSFDKALLILEEPTGEGNFADLRFDKAAFWVQIHKILLLCMNRKICLFLGNLIGDVVKIDEGASGDCWGNSYVFG